MHIFYEYIWKMVYSLNERVVCDGTHISARVVTTEPKILPLSFLFHKIESLFL